MRPRHHLTASANPKSGTAVAAILRSEGRAAAGVGSSLAVGEPTTAVLPRCPFASGCIDDSGPLAASTSPFAKGPLAVAPFRACFGGRCGAALPPSRSALWRRLRLPGCGAVPAWANSCVRWLALGSAGSAVAIVGERAAAAGTGVSVRTCAGGWMERQKESAPLPNTTELKPEPWPCITVA